jgi:hypothetical protein
MYLRRNEDNMQWEKSLLENIGSAFAATSAAIYLFGVISVNSYLMPFGLIDLDVFSARYVIPGLLVIIFMATFFVFVAIPVLRMPARLDREAKNFADSQHLRRWHLFLLVTSLTRILYLSIVGASLFSLVALTEVTKGEYWLFASFCFSIVYWMDIKNLDIKYWKVAFPVERILEILGILIFFAITPSESVIFKIVLFLFHLELR